MSLIVANENRAVPMKYYGRNEIVLRTDPKLSTTIHNILSMCEKIQKLGAKDKEWKSLQDEVENLTKTIISDNFQIENYRLEIIDTVVLPYLDEMKGRMHFDKSRFTQMKVK
jgi:hypothetical protein